MNCLNLLAWEDSTTDGLNAKEAEVALVGLPNSPQDMRVSVPVAATKPSGLQMVPDIMSCEFMVDSIRSHRSENVYNGCGISIDQG